MGRVDLEDWFYETYRPRFERIARRVYREDSSLREQGYSESDFVQAAYEEMLSRQLGQWLKRFWWQSVQAVRRRWKAGRRRRPRQVSIERSRVSEDVCEGGSPPAAHRWDQVDRLVARERASAIQFANRWKGERR